MKYRYFPEYGKLLPLPEVLKPIYYDDMACDCLNCKAFGEWLSRGIHVPDEHLWYFEGVDRDESEFKKVWYNLGGFDKPDNYGWLALPKEESQPKNTLVVSAFPGTGKTFICSLNTVSAIEVEYWKYKNEGLEDKYVDDVRKQIGVVDYVFISTDPECLERLRKDGIDFTLVYPENNLRNEYLERYIKRDSPYEFIGTFMKYWDLWIDELKKQKNCRRIILKSGEYLSDYFKVAEESKEQEDSPIEAKQSKMGLRSGDWYLNERGNRITVLYVVDGWCMVREGDKKPFVVPEEFVLGTFDKAITQ
jgi:hypothetical protein